MIPKPLKDISITDVEQLIQLPRQEDATIEYKRQLPSRSENDKKELLADISSFANAGGGDLLFGIEAKEGIPQKIQGLPGLAGDQELLYIESLLKDCIRPRIPNVGFRILEDLPGRPILIVRIPRSWAAPHVVAFKGNWKFHSRNSAGKYQMDYIQVRSSFLLHSGYADKIHDWRVDRASSIFRDDTPVMLKPSAKVALHIIPFQSLQDDFVIDVARVWDNHIPFTPIGDGGGIRRFNSDGYIAHGSPSHDSPGCRSYLQLFRNGRLETVKSIIPSKPPWETGTESYFFGSVANEIQLIEVVEKYLESYQNLDVGLPLIITISIIGAKGWRMNIGRYALDREVYPIDKDILMLPELLVEERNKSVSQLLRPAFDSLWNAIGLPRCLDYEDNLLPE